MSLDNKKVDIMEWLDNSTSPPGILKFAWHMMHEFRGNFSPEFHKLILQEILFNYSHVHKSKFDRRVGIVAFRGSAKTTLDTLLLPLYNICFKGYPSIMKYDGVVHDLTLGEDVILFVSKAAYVATQRVVNLRNQIMNNDRLKELFGDMKPQAKRDDKTGTWKQHHFELINGTNVIGLGAGQQVRGSNTDGYRPSLVVADDIYSIENTRTPETRKKYDEWFYTELLDSVDDVKGKIVFIGTIVHEDTVPLKIKESASKKNALWRYVEVPVINPDELHEILADINYDTAKGSFDMPDDNWIQDREKECKTIAWPDRLNLKFILNLYRDNLEGKTLDYMYQEYLNVVQAPENKRFVQGMFNKLQCTYKREGKVNWVYIEEDGIQNKYNANIYFGVDLASSDNVQADDTVIAIVGFLNDGRVVVLSYIYGKMGQRDELYTKSNMDTFRHSPGEIRKKGVVDEVLRLAEVYHPDIVVVETISEQAKTYQEINRVARNNDIYLRTKDYKPASNKIERLIHTLIGYYQTGSMIHQPDMNELEYQLEKLGKAKHDDIVDALHMAMMYGKKPIKQYSQEDKLNNQKRLRRKRDWMTY